MESTQQKNSHARLIRGFTLLEVMVALLVLSIGLLGLIALQTTGLRETQMSYSRTQATLLGYDITDRMRANVAGVDGDEYIIGTGAAPGGATVSATDLVEWKAAINQLLPGGTGEITQDAGPPVTHTITIRWDEQRQGAAGTNCPPQSDNDLRCHQLTL